MNKELDELEYEIKHLKDNRVSFFHLFQIKSV